MRTVELDELDGFTSRFMHVVVAHDPFMDPYVAEGGMIRTVFAWGHPVLKVTGPGVIMDKETGGEQRPASWQWLGLDDAIEPEDLTRQREVVSNLLVDLGMVGQDYEDDFENLAGALGNYERAEGTSTPLMTHEAIAFDTFIEHLGEHDLPAWVDTMVHRTPLTEEER